jgi:hypothetical protein
MSAQLYISYSDMEGQINMQCCIMAGWDKEIVTKIQRVLNQRNPFVKMFLRAGEFIRKQEVATKPWESICEPKFAQSCKDVAAILLDDNMGAERNIILHQRGGVLQRISDRQRM